MPVSSTLTFELLNKPFLLEKRIELLKAIKQTGSINKAAKVVPMSYKGAWEAIEAMNNLANSAIVLRETGGAGGGGTTLTEYGEKILQTYSILKEEHKKFIENLNRITDLNSGTLKTIRRLSMQKYECIACGYIYDPEQGDPDNGVKPGTAFADVPEDWVCPLCGVGKDQFEPVEQILHKVFNFNVYG